MRTTSASHASRLANAGNRLFMIFGKDGLEDMNAYTDVIFTSEQEANDYIKDVLEPSDKEAGVYEPNYFSVIEATAWYKF